MKVPRVSIEYWLALQAVVEYGGFNQAAEALNKSQSAISYSISKLQELLPVRIVEQQGRKAELTNAGKLLYQQVKQLIQQANELEDLARTLAQGVEPELKIAVDLLVPRQWLLAGLNQFNNEYPTCRLTLLETSLSGTDEALLFGEADILLSPRVPTGFLGAMLFQIDFLAVAHKDHPLHQQTSPISENDLKKHRQIVIRDSGLKRNQDAGWLAAEQRWTVSHFATSVSCLKEKMGFAWLPVSYIETELAEGVLKPLNLAVGQRRQLPIYMVVRLGEKAGPGTKRLAEILQSGIKKKH
ncbi:LysR family transcriptional regulator [Endozoicomonas sp. SM1973]|uniref:LysR family transcriptional regulator n=1 Tax=Spartinivicinus marinus TaxID=2994442 RepID=A0A853IAM0_9GAMM|nr:LysR family transcriptional regulator [Spartinivicinus marinus]MCX4026519.1 LysR family transcriptional regulator [Spartinivicinus marinus]NYZ66891.1 LysR family transcriptional regulator [Spartinivicinus marinus]